MEVTAERALKWNSGATPRSPQPQAPSFVVTGTGSLDPRFACVQRRFAYPDAPVQSITDPQGGLPLVWVPSLSRVIWRPDGLWGRHSWQMFHGTEAGTG